MKILIATDTYYPSINGASYFTQRLATMLAKRGHQVYVLAPSMTSENNISKNDGVHVYGVRSIGVPIYPDFRVSPLFLSQRSIKKYVKEIHPDVIHIQNHFMIGKGVLRAAKELNIPIMGTNHFMPENLVHYLHMPEFFEKELKRFGWYQFRQVFDRLDIVATPTKTAADLMKKSKFEKNINIVSCGIDLVRFNPKNDGSALKKHFNIPNGCKILLYVGRLDKEKRVEIILRAIPQIAKKVDVHFVIAGVGKLRKTFERKAQKFGIRDRITFTGFVKNADLPNLYRVADLFVIAGIAELQSIVTMEAMASGLPVLAVNKMALPELVHDSENGYLFKDGDSRAIAEKASKILSDEKLRARMSKKSLEIIKNHDINKTLEKYESLYLETINHADFSSTNLNTSRATN